jgi:Transposase IS4
MFVPRKPWPFGNVYHLICCGVSGVMFGIEMVEGKDAPTEAPAKQFDNMGKTVGLLLRLIKPLWGTAKMVVLDSGFCVLKGIIELKKRGVYAASLIKKRRYWPKYTAGEDIKQHFEDKEVGDVNTLPGVMEEVPFHIYAMKEPDYTLMMMTTYGTPECQGKTTRRKLNNGEVKTF